MLNSARLSHNANCLSEEKTVAAWLINLRWLAIAAQLICLIPGLRLGFVLSAHVMQYLAIVMFLVFFNLFSAILIRKNFHDVHLGNFCQLVIDLLALILLLSISTEKQNPMVALFYFHTALGAMLLRRWQRPLFLLCLQVGITYVLLHSGSVFLPSDSTVPSATVGLIAQLFLVMIIWLLMSSLSQHLSALRTRLSELAGHQRRIENLRILGASTASFCHLFATPLNTIKLRVERLTRVKAQLPGLLSDEIESLRHAVFQCEQVVRTLFESGNTDDQSLLRSVEICNFLQAVCAGWGVDKANVRLNITIDENIPEHTRCKIPELTFARNIIDLLDNALEASQSLQVDINVSICLKQDMVEIEVNDNGPGVPSTVKDALGEPFITTKKNGSGLGLFSALSMAQALGGDLKIKDGVRRGTSVLLTIPSDGDSRCQ